MATTSANIAAVMLRSARLGELCAKMELTRPERVEMMSLQKAVIKEQIDVCMNGTDSITTFSKQLPSLWKSYNMLEKNSRNLPVNVRPIPTLIQGETFCNGEWVKISTETIKGRCIGRAFNRIRWTFRGVVLDRGQCIIYKNFKNDDDRGQYPKVTQHKNNTWSFCTVIGDTTLIICSIGGEKHCGLVHLSPSTTRKRPNATVIEDSTSVVAPVSKKRK